jgi:hypothetical protein
MGGSIFKLVGAVTPTQKFNDSTKIQIFTIFAPTCSSSLHPQGWVGDAGRREPSV